MPLAGARERGGEVGPEPAHGVQLPGPRQPAPHPSHAQTHPGHQAQNSPGAPLFRNVKPTYAYLCMYIGFLFL